MRFQNITVPPGAIIASASIQFTANLDDGYGGEDTSLTIIGEDSDDASAFAYEENNISNRPRTAVTVAWSNVPQWSDNQTYDTPDIAAILQEIIDRPGWASGNDLVLMIEGSGRRPADSFEESAASAPLLTLAYRLEGVTMPSCLNLNILSGAYLAGLPTDPSLGSAERTYYAVLKTAANRVHVEACGAEMGEQIAAEQ